MYCTFVLTFPVYLESHPRPLVSSLLLPALRPPRPLDFQTFRRLHIPHAPKSFPLYSFADPHPLNLFASILYKNIGGKGVHSSRSPKSFTCNIYRTRRKCCIQKTYAQAKSFRCNICKKPGAPCLRRSGGYPSISILIHQEWHVRGNSPLSRFTAPTPILSKEATRSPASLLHYLIFLLP
jgi:hypothetical protein